MDLSSLSALTEEHAELERKLADPNVHADAKLARRLARRYAELGPIVKTMRELRSARDDLDTAAELAQQDAGLAEEAETLRARIPALESQLTELLLPRDEHDASDIVLEIKSGAGGEESALFAGDLLRMYSRYAEQRGWKITVLGSTESDLGGYKDVTVGIAGSGVDPDEGVWSWMKFEGGVHRVQRVPVTESQGRIHTSAAGVLVFPETDDEAQVEVDENDLRIDTYRSSGKGGQGVNTTDSAVRLTHLPTGVVVACQNERSQLQNKNRAMQVLTARLQQMAEEQAAAEAADQRHSQIRTVDRSERVRTYNYPENRISDHRVNFKAYNLDRVLDGELDPVLNALREADKQARLAQSAKV